MFSTIHIVINYINSTFQNVIFYMFSKIHATC